VSIFWFWLGAHGCFRNILEARGDQEAKRAQAVIDGHHDDVRLVGLEDALVQQVCSALHVRGRRREPNVERWCKA